MAKTLNCLDSVLQYMYWLALISVAQTISGQSVSIMGLASLNELE